MRKNKMEYSETMMHYLDINPTGNPVVLMLHGLGADGSSWGYQIPSLCEAGMRPIAPDLPGFGRSDPGKGRWSVGEAASRVVSLVEQLHIGPMVVVGISMGGTVALTLALDFPERVEKLVLVSTFACLRPKQYSEMGYLLGRFVVTNIRGKQYQAETVAHRLFPLPEQDSLRREMIERILEADEKVYREAMISLGLFDVRKRLKEIQKPTLVVTGEKDTTVSPKAQAELARLIPGAVQVTFADSGHAVTADNPTRFNKALLDFILGPMAPGLS